MWILVGGQFIRNAQKTQHEKSLIPVSSFALIVGTAFAIKSIEYENKYYLLTAYHVISELKAKGQKILVKDENDSFYSTEVIFPKNLSQEFRTFGQDYALLEMYSNIKYEAFDIAIIEKYEECYVR